MWGKAGAEEEDGKALCGHMDPSSSLATASCTGLPCTGLSFRALTAHQELGWDLSVPCWVYSSKQPMSKELI